jgi:hypothetical protein
VAGDTNIRRVTMVLLETGLPGLRVVDEHGTVTGSISRASATSGAGSSGGIFSMWTMMRK